MATNNKDFVVKNGLLVTNGAIFGAPIEIPSPTDSVHAATKSYVDTLIASVGGGGSATIVVDSVAPSSPSDGTLWLDTTIEKLKVYLSNSWITIASIDYGIESDGVFYSYFDGGQVSIPQGYVVDGGDPFTTSFVEMPTGNPESTLFLSTLDGGVPA